MASCILLSFTEAMSLTVEPNEPLSNFYDLSLLPEDKDIFDLDCGVSCYVILHRIKCASAIILATNCHIITTESCFC